MAATSIKNILDFVCDLNVLIGVHQHPFDQHLYCVDGFFLPAFDLSDLDTALLLRQHLAE